MVVLRVLRGANTAITSCKQPHPRACTCADSLPDPTPSPPPTHLHGQVRPQALRRGRRPRLGLPRGTRGPPLRQAGPLELAEKVWRGAHSGAVARARVDSQQRHVGLAKLLAQRGQVVLDPAQHANTAAWHSTARQGARGDHALQGVRLGAVDLDVGMWHETYGRRAASKHRQTVWEDGPIKMNPCPSTTRGSQPSVKALPRWQVAASTQPPCRRTAPRAFTTADLPAHPSPLPNNHSHPAPSSHPGTASSFLTHPTRTSSRLLLPTRPAAAGSA